MLNYQRVDENGPSQIRGERAWKQRTQILRQTLEDVPPRLPEGSPAAKVVLHSDGTLSGSLQNWLKGKRYSSRALYFVVTSVDFRIGSLTLFCRIVLHLFPWTNPMILPLSNPQDLRDTSHPPRLPEGSLKPPTLGRKSWETMGKP